MKQFTVHSLWFTVILMLLSPAGFGQTNFALIGSAETNVVIRLPALSDFQRLQYYYAAHANSPAPGTEHQVFTLKPARTWNNDWNSTFVPKPTRSQLNAITALQFDVFRRAAVYTNGAWRVATSVTNIPLATLNVSAATYARIHVASERDRLQRQVLQLNQQLQQLTPVSETPVPVQ